MTHKSIRKFEIFEKDGIKVMYFGNLAISDDLKYIGYSNLSFVNKSYIGAVLKNQHNYKVAIANDDKIVATFSMSRSKDVEADNKFDNWLKEHKIDFLDYTEIKN